MTLTQAPCAHICPDTPEASARGSHRLRLILAIGALLATPAAALAATTPSSMGVTSTVQATCLNTVTPMAFGIYTGVLASSTATLSVTCTNTTPYTVALSAGLSTGATVHTRALTGPGGALLHYALTSDLAGAVNWGLTVSTDTVAGTGTGAAQPITIYGQEAAGQFVTPGAYTDTITATVAY